MPDESKEQKAERLEEFDIDQAIIKSVFSEYQQLIENQGSPGEPDEPIDKSYQFFIDHTEDEDAKFERESVICNILKISPDKYFADEFYSESELHAMRLKQLIGQIKKGESWILVDIQPGDTYRPSFALRPLITLEEYGKNIWNEFDQETREKKDLLTDNLIIIFSNQGRGFQATEWASAYTIGLDMKKVPSAKGLIEVKKEKDIIKEPFKPLQGTTLERLKYILEMARTGKVISAD